MDLTKIIDRKRRQLEELEDQMSELRSEMETLQRAMDIALREMSGSEIGPLVPAPPAPKAVTGKVSVAASSTLTAGGRKLIDVIRDCVPSLPEPFSTTELRERLKTEAPDLVESSHYTSISGTVRRMATGGELVLVQKGGPGKEALYRRNAADRNQGSFDLTAAQAD